MLVLVQKALSSDNTTTDQTSSITSISWEKYRLYQNSTKITMTIGTLPKFDIMWKKTLLLPVTTNKELMLSKFTGGSGGRITGEIEARAEGIWWSLASDFWTKEGIVIFLRRGGSLWDLAVGFLHRKAERPELAEHCQLPYLDRHCQNL